MIFNINSTRGQTRFLTCIARVTCLVSHNVPCVETDKSGSIQGKLFKRIANVLDGMKTEVQYQYVPTYYTQLGVDVESDTM